MMKLKQFLLLLIVTTINVTGKLQTLTDQTFYHEKDPTITSVENQLNAYIKRGFTNVGVKVLNGENVNASTDFDTISFKENLNHITIKNLRFSHPLILRMLQTETDLTYNVLTVDIAIGNIIIYGDYEAFNMDLFNIIPITLQGNIEIILENVRTFGHIGIRKFGDSFVSSNFDLEYEMGRIQTTYEYFTLNGIKETKVIRKDTLDETLVKSFKFDLLNKIQYAIRQKLDIVLLDLSITDTFRNDDDIIERYSRRSVELDEITGNFVDKLIIEFNTFNENHTSIAIDDYHTSFEHRLGFTSVNGDFLASYGYAGNIASLQRKDTFSIFPNRQNSTITIFGTIGLREIKCGYNHYRAKLLFLNPSGSIHMTAGDNSLFFKVQTATFALGFPDFTQIKYELSVEKLDDVKFQISGLYGGPLDWLISQSSTWMIGYFKTAIIVNIEKAVKESIDSLLSKNRNDSPTIKRI